MSARPFQVGDRVRITGWTSYGPHEGTVEEIEPAGHDDQGRPYPPYLHIRTAPYTLRNGQTTTIASCSLNADATGPDEYGGHTIELLAAAPETTPTVERAAGTALAAAGRALWAATTNNQRYLFLWDELPPDAQKHWEDLAHEVLAAGLDAARVTARVRARVLGEA